MTTRGSSWQRTISLSAIVLLFLTLLSGQNLVCDAESEDIRPEAVSTSQEGDVAHARRLASILFESVHGSLQVMHRDLFQEEESLQIPSRSLEDVFGVLKRKYNVQLRWLAVDTPAMNIDHEPSNDLEKEAVRVLRNPEGHFESVEGNQFHFAGRIRLSTTCLGCHVPRRSDNDDRFAGLLMTLDLRSEPSQEEE
ncbi:DUF3365 domain-containing protein [Thalassoglobus sp. JC818]|uniref:c-type heme family protein n=1 Tax=Thalassoglobus sp. JC818 TaxID=3232136 RepID=UPI00345A4A29